MAKELVLFADDNGQHLSDVGEGRYLQGGIGRMSINDVNADAHSEVVEDLRRYDIRSISALEIQPRMVW